MSKSIFVWLIGVIMIIGAIIILDYSNNALSISILIILPMIITGVIFIIIGTVANEIYHNDKRE